MLQIDLVSIYDELLSFAHNVIKEQGVYGYKLTGFRGLFTEL